MDTKQKVEHVLDAGNRWLERLSLEWREHANRRSVLALLAGGITATLLYTGAIAPPDEFPLGELVTISQGASLSETAAALEKKGVVRSGFALRVLVTLMGHERDVHAGDYLFMEPKDMFTVARAISSGAYGLEPLRVRIIEGARTKDMAALLAKRFPRFDAERFLANAQPLEGYLFPDTYFFMPNATDEEMLQAMRQNFDARIAEIQPQIDAFGKPFKDIVIMASLIEREAKNSNDRRMIAGVLWNRLARGMLLQVDAAFLYTLGKGTFQLTLADLRSDSPYNTYKYKGLPPGAIGNPSLDALLAAVTPIKSEYLYYLADDDHVTHYSKTYEEHLRKKKLYLGT